jgi:hopene-associated glycosyltransferase HpnB
VIAETLSVLALAIWLYLVCAHGGFWRSRPELPAARPSQFPAVDIIVPARNEARTIQAVIGSLLAQDYDGEFSVTLVDDGSTDGTAACAGSAPNLRHIDGAPKPNGWSGKLWALYQGVDATSAPVVFLTDADIVHDPRHLSALVARLLCPAVGLVSEMVRLNCASAAERLLIPAFVYFFQLLYPFARVNNPRSAVAAAAGGTMVLWRKTLQHAGGIEAIRGTLIDDVSLAKAVKKSEPIYLGHSGLATSLRTYPSASDVWGMIARTAFTQLRYSGTLLVLTILGLALVFLVPPGAVLFGHGRVFAAGAAAYALMSVSYAPTLNRYGQPWLFAIALPLIALFYMCATLGSAINWWSGKGSSWKGRGYDANSEAR